MKLRKVILVAGLLFATLPLFGCNNEKEPQVYKNFETSWIEYQPYELENTEFKQTNACRYRSFKPHVGLNNYGNYLSYDLAALIQVLDVENVKVTSYVNLVTDGATILSNSSSIVFKDKFVSDYKNTTGGQMHYNGSIDAKDIRKALGTSKKIGNELEIRFGTTACFTVYTTDDYVIQGEETVVTVALEYGEIVVKDIK